MFSLRLNGLLVRENDSSLSHCSILKTMARPALMEEDKRVVQVNIRLAEAENDSGQYLC